MHGFAKRALALIAAASGLILGSSAVASADTSASGRSTLSGGVGSGNVADLPLDVPVNFCGDQAVAAALESVDRKPLCEIGANGVNITSSTYKSGGVLSGNNADGALFAGGNVCGNQAVALAVKSMVGGVDCRVDTSGAPEASVVASTDKSGGVLSGNVLDLAAVLPLNVCGNQLALAAVESRVHGVSCSIN